MVINFNDIAVTKLEQFKGGTGTVAANMYTDSLIKIMHMKLEKGVSIGYHTHDTSCEVVYILSGRATVNYEGSIEYALPGQTAYCPKGHSHCISNEDEEPLEFLAIVPEQ